VGRVPASYIQEVEDYVSKIISYETNIGSSWFDNVVLWDSEEPLYDDQDNLDLIASELLPAFTAKKHYRTDEFESFDFSQRIQYREDWKEGIMADINQGAGFAIMIGHGSRRSLGILKYKDISELGNYGMYPVFISNGCDTAKFVQEWDIYMDTEGNYPPCWPDCDQKGWPDPAPEPAYIQPSIIDVDSMAEVLLFSPYGGGIGFLGSYTGTNEAGPPYVKLFIGSWNHGHVTRLGDMWTTAVHEFAEQYLETDHPYSRSSFMSMHIHLFGLFGDPSLRMKE
jgi:hypothetical protein